jgi:glycosyltransferase involved in cell wall biosynthesis
VDVIHDHTLVGPLLARGRVIPTVVTVHGPVTGEPGHYYRHLGDSVRLVAISEAQRRAAADLNWCATVHNAINATHLPFRENKRDWVLFLGRCTPDKGMHLAIDAARLAGRNILLAAKCSEPAEAAYFEAEIKPRLGPDAQWLGEVGGERKKELLSEARCLLFPIQWEEPFGMVMIEAMACGTPVVALRRGSVPEVVTHGITGLVCNGPAELPSAINAAHTIDPTACRNNVLSRFHPDIMAARYEHTYQQALAHAQHLHHRLGPRHPSPHRSVLGAHRGHPSRAAIPAPHTTATPGR